MYPLKLVFWTINEDYTEKISKDAKSTFITFDIAIF